MCDLCSDDEAVTLNAKRDHANKARHYEKMAKIHKDMSSGVLKPHSDELTRRTKFLAPHLLHQLVNDWI